EARGVAGDAATPTVLGTEAHPGVTCCHGCQCKPPRRLRDRKLEKSLGFRIACLHQAWRRCVRHSCSSSNCCPTPTPLNRSILSLVYSRFVAFFQHSYSILLTLFSSHAEQDPRGARAP